MNTRMTSPAIGRVVAGSVLLMVAACSSQQTPTSPGETPANTNRLPVISISANRTFGISQISTFSFTASASDPDGDPVTVSWNLGDGTANSGTAVSRVYTGSGTMTVVATASDGRGGTTQSAGLSVVVGGLTGTWTGTIDTSTCGGPVKPLTATFSQNGASITGQMALPQGICNFTPGTAVTDPAEPGTINGNGDVRVRVKVPPFIDIYFVGQLDSSGRRVTGGLQGSGQSGTPFVWNKQ